MILKKRKLNKKFNAKYQSPIPVWRTLHFQVATVVLFSIILPAAIVLLQRDAPLAYAETGSTSVVPDGDYGTTNNFAELSASPDTSCAGGTHCDHIDEDGETDYLGTGLGMDGTTAEEEFDFATPTISGTLISIDQVDVTFNAGIVTSCAGSGGTPCDSFNLRLYIDGAYNGTTKNGPQMTTSPADYTVSWTGLSATTGSDIRVEIVRVAQGGGSASAKDDNVRLYDVRADVDYTYLPARSMITLEDYLFENDDGLSGSETKSAGTGANDASYGTVAWTDPGGITADGAPAATAFFSSSGTSQYIKGTNFGFNIPDSAEITGIQAVVNMYADQVTSIQDSRVRIIKGGTIGTSDRSFFTGALYWSTSASNTYTYPTSSNTNDLWGQTWTPSDINASTFGLAMSAFTTGSTKYANIDYIEMIVYYNDPATAQAGSQFSSPKTLDGIRQGERTNLRMHLKNTGEGAITLDDELALFYDKNDGNWSKVSSGAPSTGPSASDDCLGFRGAGGSSDFKCETVIDGESILDFYTSNSAALGKSGNLQIVVPIYDENRTASVAGTDLAFATYVGRGGNCDGFDDTGGSDEWHCSIIIDGQNNESYNRFASQAVDQRGITHIATRRTNAPLNTTGTNLVHVEYVGSGGNCDGFDDVGGSDSWQCTTVLDGDHASSNSESVVAIAPDGNPAIISHGYQSATNQIKLIYSKYVGSGGDCDGFLDTGGSDAWECTLLESTASTNNYGSLDIAFNDNGEPLISFEYDIGGNSSVRLFSYLGSGGNCVSNTWQCDTVLAKNDNIKSTALAISPENIPFVTTGTGSDLYIAKYVGGAGGDCNTVMSAGSSADWDCTLISETFSSGNDRTHSLIFGPDGLPNIVTRGGVGVTLAKYVGSGGNCATFEPGGGGSSEWQCETILDKTDASDYYNLDAMYDYKGSLHVVTRTFDNTSGNNLIHISYEDKNQISIARSQVVDNGVTIETSRADMTSATDTTNRDDADCISGSTSWNNGVYFGAEIGTGAVLPAGDTTAQCTEVMWTLDTSQAIPGATYRFVVATKDAHDQSMGVWRGPIQIDEYPTITIAEDFEQSTRYSKTLVESDADGCLDDATWSCTTLGVGGGIDDLVMDGSGNPWMVATDTSSFDRDVHVGHRTPGAGSGCSDSDWTCYTVDTEGNIDNDVGIAVAPNGDAYIAYATSSNNVKVAQYVGSGGDCVDTAWECTVVDSTLTTPTDVKIAISSTGAITIAYTDTGSSSDLRIAEYVGSGGDCSSTAWECTTVDATGTVGNGLHVAYDQNNIQHITYSDVTNGTLKLAKYVGSGGNCDSTGGSDAWQCTDIDGTDDVGESFIAFDASNNAWISYNPVSQTDLYVARYVGGSSGDCATSFSGDSDDWDCEVVDSIGSVGDRSSIAFGSDGTTYVSYKYGTSNTAYATYVGTSGSCSGAGSVAWDCDVLPKDDATGWIYAKTAVDESGHLFFAVSNSTSNSIRIVKPDLPLDSLSAHRSSRSIPSGDYQYRLGSGRSPFNSTGVNCTGNSLFSGYCGLDSDNGDYDSLLANGPNEMPLYGMATKVGANTTVPSIGWIGNTNLAPSTSGTAGDIVIEAYRFGTTNAWEEVARDSTSTNCSTNNCVLNGIPSGTVSEYFETINSEYWYYVRVYQETDGTTTINFKVDAFKATQLTSALGQGAFFRDGVLQPLNQRR